MAVVKLKPVPPSDPVAAEAGPAVLRLNDLGAIETGLTITPWFRHLLAWRKDNSLTLRAAIYIVAYVITQTGLHGPRAHWARLALMDWLGRVDATTLNDTALNRLLLDLESLYTQATTTPRPSADAFTRYALSRRAAARQICGPQLDPFMVIYERAIEALSPFLTT